MVREHEVNCKRCGKKLGYSDRAYRNSLKFGYSRPEYCDECKPKHGKEKAKMGSPYFDALFETQTASSKFGQIARPPREHITKVKKSHFDETRFGLTQDRVREIADWFGNSNHRVVIVVGPTGSGKSTALPYWLVYPPEGIEPDFFTRDGQILATQPRILAMKKIAGYLGPDLMGSSVGAGFDIGYSYSKEDKTDWRNAIELATDGKLVNWIVAGRISQFGLILLDEAHERSENIETILRLLKDRMGLYPNLKLIVLSATIDAEFFRQYFDREGAKVIEFEGKSRVDANGNPVKYEVFFAPEEWRLPYEEVGILSKAVSNTARENTKWLAGEIVAKRKDWGDILIFLHGKESINKLVEELRAWVNQDEVLAGIIEVYPLYRDENEDLTDPAYENPRPGKLRIFVSTNIAEASVTIDSIVYEIETGVEIQPNFKTETGATKYPTVLISKANAKQRWGRTGRTRNGEVYCLYTEQQFNVLFPEYPVTAMQRSNMESIVLTAKAAGIPNVTNGWLENPPQSEVERSAGALIRSGALTEEKSLTSYGLMVRQFSYAPKLVTLLMAADDTGCSVEMATILPVIKNGGVKRLLSWKFSWDIYAKRTAYRHHLALMAGCRDDPEFILKLYKAWDELPWLDTNQLRELTEEQADSLRQQWAELHFVNHRAMLAIREERNQIIERFVVNIKTEKPPLISLLQINRVRTLLQTMLSETELKTAPDQYRYDSEAEPQTGSLATCSLIALNGGTGRKTGSWIETLFVKKETEDVFSRLFVDQVYPVGYRFTASAESQENGYTWIQTRRNLTRAEALVSQQMTYLSERDDEPEDDSEEENDSSPKKEEKPGVSLTNISILYGSVNCNQAVCTLYPPTRLEFVVEITGFQFQPEKQPVVIAEIVLEPEPFDVFAERHRYSDEVTVEVVDILQFEGDSTAALVVKEIETGLEVLLEPQDLSFTKNAYAVTRIPKGTRLILNIEHIDLKLRRVRLTNWEKVEKSITDRFVSSEGNKETTVAKAEVVEIHSDGRVMFALDLGQTTPDVCIITEAYGNKLSKRAGEFTVGEKVALKVSRRFRDTAYAELSSLPAMVAPNISREEKQNELTWRGGKLRYTGRITYERLYELKTLADKNIDFQRALEKLYWYSNRVQVDQFIDNELFNLAVGSTVDNAVVKEINNGGVMVQLGNGITGFVPKSKVMGGARNISILLAVGSTVKVKVLEQRAQKNEPLLEITGGITDPLLAIRVGQKCYGVVKNINNDGVFVALGLWVTGRVRNTEVYRNWRKIEDLFKTGDKVSVMVLSVNQKERQLELTMKLPENNPTILLDTGQSYAGIVTRVVPQGAFIEMDRGLIGLLRTEDFPKSSGFLGLGSPPIIEKGMKLIAKIVLIQPDNKDVFLKYVRQVK